MALLPPCPEEQIGWWILLRLTPRKWELKPLSPTAQ